MSGLLGRRIGALAFPALIAMVLVACGGGEATPTTPPKPTAAAVTPTPTTSPSTPAATPTPTPVPTRAPTAPPRPSTAQPKYGGTLHVRQGAEMPSWDTYDALGGFSTIIVSPMMSNLIMQDLDDLNKLVPDAAERWEVSQDGKVITLFLRKDVKWHDGKPFTADDVLYTLNRGWKGTGRITFNLRKFVAVQNIEKVDDSTVRITLSRVSASFLGQIAQQFVLMYPAHITDMAKWQAQPVGSGPFMFSRWQRDVVLELVRTPGHFKKDADGRQLPYLDSIQYFTLPDPATAAAALKAGKVDCGCLFNADYLLDQLDILRRDIPGLKTSVGYSVTMDLMFNLKRPPYDNRLVREALSSSIDRLELTKLLYPAVGVRFPPGNLLPPEIGGQWGLSEAEIRTFPGFRDASVDRAHSDQLFKDANVDPKGIVADFVVSAFFKVFGEPLQNMLSKTGAKVNLRIADNNTYNQDVQQNGRFDIALSTGHTDINNPNDQFLEYITKDGFRNPGKIFDVPDVDRLAADQDQLLDVAARRAKLWELQRLLLKETLFVPVMYNPTPWATAARMEGFVAKSSIGPHFRMERVWVKT